jgi:ribonuclease HI
MHWMSWDKVTRPKAQGGIGFRNLRVFNQALLARQAWRLLHFPDSLCARLLKARYYPAGNLIDTAFIQNQSQTWRGIVYGLELLKKGIIWRIGDGSKVKIFRDNWLPRPGALKPDGRKGSSRRKWVSELIRADSRTWDVEAVRECCWPHDANTILGIKLAGRASDDFLAWSGESSGLFSVRSAYRIGMQASLQNLSRGQSSFEPTGDRTVWEVVWKANVPQKLRVFAWRAATDSLGVLAGLYHRISSINPICSICGREEEDVHHALVRCTLARALRDELRSHWTLPTEEQFLAKEGEWLFHLLHNASRDTRPKIIFLLWRVWHHRNNVVHGDGKASISAPVPYLVSYHDSFTMIRSGGSDKAHFTSWVAPMLGSVKANVDAGWDSTTKNAGVGIIIRDHLGHTLLAEWKFLPFCGSAEEAEVIACLEGLRHLILLRRWPATLESDCLRVVHAITSDKEEQSASWAAILEAREMLKIYHDITVAKVDRVNNGVAHVLAQLGKSGLSDISRDSAPDCVRDLIAVDCMNTM